MYIGNDLQIAHPSYKIIDDISSGFNGSATSFALHVNGAAPVPFPINTQQVMISVNGTVQEPDPTGTNGFKLTGSNIVFSSAPGNNESFFGVIYAGADYVTAGSEFPDGSVTSPSFTFQDDQNTGWYRSGDGAVSYSANSTNILTFDGNGLSVTSGNVTIPDKIIHSGDLDTSIRFPAADTFAVETGGSERARVDSSGHLLLGHTTSIGEARAFQIVGTTADSSSAQLIRHSADASCSQLDLTKSRNATKGSNTIVQDNDVLGQITFRGDDGTDFNSTGATISAAVDGTPGANDMPGRLVFSTTADGAAAATERIRIDKAGLVGIGTNSPSKRLHVATSQQHVALFESTNDATSGPEVFIKHNPGAGNMQDNDVIALLQFQGVDAGNNETLFSSIRAVAADVTSTEEKGDLAFWTCNGSDFLERFRIDSSGRLLIGIATTSTVFGIKPRLQVEGVDSHTSTCSLTRNSANAHGSYLTFGKSRGTSTAATTIVQNDDTIGTITFNGADGTNLDHVFAEIKGQVDGTPGENDVPGRLTFFTTPDGTITSTERLRIHANGRVGIGNATNNANDVALFQVVADDGEASDLYVGQFTNSEATAGQSFGVNIIAGSSATDHGLRVRNRANDTTHFEVRGDGSVRDSKGDLRDIPANAQNGAYTLVVSDTGKVVANQSGGWTIPASVFTTVGQTVTLLNNSASSQNITASALTYLYNTANGDNIKANTIALGARAMATIWFNGGDTGYIQSSKITVS